MVPHPVLLEEIPSLLDGDADSQQDGAPHADIWVLLLDLSRLPWGWYFKNELFSGKYRWEFVEFLNFCDAQCDSNHEYPALWWTDIKSQISNKESDRSSFVIYTESEWEEKFFLRKEKFHQPVMLRQYVSGWKISRTNFIISGVHLGPPLTLSRKEMMR